MVNVLIVDDNFDYSKNLINIIANENPKIRLYNICTDGKEVIDVITHQQEYIDIILLDLKLPNYSGIEILKYMENNKLNKYKDSIIVISGELDFLLKVRNNTYVHSFVSKTSGFDSIIKEINELVKIKDTEKNSIEYKVHEELEKLNFNFSYIGTQYLFETILILYNKYKNCFEMQKLEKNIYPIVAKKYKKTVNNIKTNIINVCDLMCYDCKDEVLKVYFGDTFSRKPTPKIIMITILNKLKYSI